MPRANGLPTNEELDVKVPPGLPPKAAAAHNRGRNGRPGGGGDRRPGRPNPVPWSPRTMSADGIELVPPSHLQFLTDVEKEIKHYPHAARGRFCACCGRPVTNEGRSGAGHKGKGKPCPECGFRRKSIPSEKQLALWKDPDRIAKWKAGRDAKTHTSLAQQARNRGKGKLKVTDLMEQRAQEQAEMIVRPYLEGLKLAPKEEWSPGTKLEFYMNQTQIAEKFLNRVEGMPVSRTRHVDAEDEDVLKDGELSAGTLVQLVAAIATGSTGDFDDAVEVQAEEVG